MEKSAIWFELCGAACGAGASVRKRSPAVWEWRRAGERLLACVSGSGPRRVHYDPEQGAGVRQRDLVEGAKSRPQGCETLRLCPGQAWRIVVTPKRLGRARGAALGEEKT